MNKKQMQTWFWIILIVALIPLAMTELQQPPLTAEQKLGAYTMSIIVLMGGLFLLNWKVLRKHE